MVAITTKDFVDALVKVSYCVNFLPKDKDKWFAVENYIKFLCDSMRAEIRREAKKYNIEDFYQNYAEVVRNVVLNLEGSTEDKGEATVYGHYFPQNGMNIVDCEVLGLNIESEVENMLEDHQREMVKKSLQLTGAKRRVEVAEKLSEAEKKEHELRSEQLKNKMELQAKETQEKLKLEAEINRQKEAEKAAAKEAEKALQPLMDAIQEANLAREKKESDMILARKKAEADIEKARLDAQASTIAKVMESIGPDLVAAMNTSANADIVQAIAKSLAPYAMAKGESVADFTDKLLRGTTLEGIVSQAVKKN